MRYTLTFAFVLLAGSAFAQTPIYVFTAHDSSGFTDKATEERLKSVDGIKSRLAKNKTVTLVDSADAAKVVIELTSVGYEDTGDSQSTTSRGLFGTVNTTTQEKSEYSERATLKAGTYQTELQAGIKMFGATHPGEQLTKKIEEWLKKNAAALQR